MREMKNSGVEWIGEIPKEWKIKRLKMIFGFGKGLPITKGNLVETGIPVISYGQIHAKFNLGTKITDDLIRFVPDNYVSSNSESLVHKGDILVADTSEDIEGCGNSVYVDKDVMLFADYHTIILKSFNNGNKYLAYLFKTDAWRSQIRSQVSGVKLFSITKRILSSVTVILPPIHEQTAIASYLDKKCSNIDAIITKNGQIIEKLKEYKSSLISEAVTKGLNPDVKMKNSGVEWIGEIPAEWSYGRIKYNYYLKGRIGWQGLKASEFIDDGPYLVTGTDFINGEINWESCYHISEERYNEAPEIHVKVGDLLITKDGTVGKVAFIKTKPDKVSLNSHLLIMRSLNNSYSNRFLFWIIQSNVFELYFQLTQSGSIMASLSQEKINNFSFPLPPLSEQIAIASYLDEKCSIIDSNIANRELINAKLAEYKKSLIYEVVTGKKEII